MTTMSTAPTMEPTCEEKEEGLSQNHRINQKTAQMRSQGSDLRSQGNLMAKNMVSNTPVFASESLECLVKCKT